MGNVIRQYNKIADLVRKKDISQAVNVLLEARIRFGNDKACKWFQESVYNSLLCLLPSGQGLDCEREDVFCTRFENAIDWIKPNLRDEYNAKLDGPVDVNTRIIRSRFIYMRPPRPRAFNHDADAL